MKERPILFSAPMVRAIMAGTKTQTRLAVKREALQWLVRDKFSPAFVADPGNHLSPYGHAGDRLWVREAWMDLRGVDGAIADCMFRATFGNAPDGGKWRPSIHMPRWASRITLEVTGVRVERLQDISEADAQAEGCALECMSPVGSDSGSAIHGPGGYIALWESINGPESWAANPWVWVVEFKRMEMPA